MIEHNHCPHCGRIIDKREIGLFVGMVVALKSAYDFCVKNNIHEFEMKQVRDMMDRNAYARFGDWKMFGGVVYGRGKAKYGLNMERCEAFFRNEYKIPTKIIKDPLLKTISLEDYRYCRDMPNLKEYIGLDGLFIAQYHAQDTKENI